MTTPTSNLAVIITSLLLMIGLAWGGIAIGQGLKDFRRGERSVEVKGLAEKPVKADLGIWNLRYTGTGNDLAALLTKIDKDTQAITGFLSKAGFKSEEIIPQRTEVIDLLAQQYRNQGAEQNRFIISGNLLVRSSNVDLMNTTASSTGDLARQGVVLDSTNNTYNTPYYLFTKLNDIKPGMIAEATRGAREAAKQFAKDSHSQLGAIKRASQGYFSILPLNQTPNAEEAREINKTVRIVTTIEYALGD